MSKHTPGPWIAEVNEKAATIAILGYLRNADYVRASDGRGMIVSVECASDPDAIMFSPMDSEQVANAHLIAAALELLDALEVAREYVAKVHGTIAGANDQGDSVVKPDLDKIDSAIAKARGEGLY